MYDQLNHLFCPYAPLVETPFNPQLVDHLMEHQVDFLTELGWAENPKSRENDERFDWKREGF